MCFATCDVAALYPNVNNDMGLLAVASLLREHPSQLGFRTDCVLEALDIALTNNTCVYSDETTSAHARPNRGAAMGPSHACDYVDVFMSELDKKLVSTCPVPLLSSLVPHHLLEQYRYLDWSRFRDDGFALLLDSEHIQPSTECLQSLHPPNIKWTVSHGKSATYLKDGKKSPPVCSVSTTTPILLLPAAIRQPFLKGLHRE